MAFVRFVLVITLLAGCAHQSGASAAANSSPSLATVRAAASKLVVCQTTEAELRAQLGAPYRDGKLAQGRVLSWLPAGDADSKHYLAVLLRDGLVVDYYFDVPTEIVWTPADRCTTGSASPPTR